MKQTFNEFWSFLKSPSFRIYNRGEKSLWKDFLWLFLFDLVFVIVFFSAYYVLLSLNLIKEYKGWDILKEYGLYWGFLIVCFFAPLTEEFIFRWHLTKQYASLYFILLSLATITILGIDSDVVVWLVFLSYLVLAIILHLKLKKISQTLKYKLWQKSYPFIFYFSALIFGLIHLGNYEELTLADPSFIFYIGSQTFGGLILGYLRIKHGLSYSILFHTCFNFVALSLELIFG